MPWRYPADNRHVPAGGGFLSRYLDNGQPRSLPHSGVDYSRYAGSPVYIIGPGVVVRQGTNRYSGWGYYTYVDHGDIGDGSGRHAYSYYAHNQNLGPAPGVRYAGGEHFNAIGATGSGITGAHLHWGVAVCTPSQFTTYVLPMGAAARNYLVDPEAFVAARILQPNQRQVKPSATARRRISASTTASYDPNANLAAGSNQTPSGFVVSPLPGGEYAGSRDWLVIGGLFSHVSAFTDTGTHDLVNLTAQYFPPEPEPEPEPEVHTVTFNDAMTTTPVEVVDGHPIPADKIPAPQVAEGYSFAGWFTGSGGDLDAFDLSTPIISDLVLTSVYDEIEEPEPEPEPEPEEPHPSRHPAAILGIIISIIVAGVVAFLNLFS